MSVNIEELNFFKEKQEEIVSKGIEWLQTNIPDRTNNYDKCRRDIRFVLDAYFLDLSSGTLKYTINIASKYWNGNRRQVQYYRAEKQVHEFLAEYIYKNIFTDEWLKNKTIYLKNLFINILDKGLVLEEKEDGFSKYNYVTHYKKESDEALDKIISDALDTAWRYTPSKNNFMPYKVHVLGPSTTKTKELLFWKCLQHQTKCNNDHRETVEDLKDYLKKHYPDPNFPAPSYANLLSAPYVLIFTHRVVTKPNNYQKSLIERGWNFEQMATNGEKKESAKKIARLEIGMFSAAFSNYCLSRSVDVSHTACAPQKLELYFEPEFSFLDSTPMLIMTAGRGEKFRRTGMPEGSDFKPDYKDIVNLVD